MATRPTITGVSHSPRLPAPAIWTWFDINVNRVVPAGSNYRGEEMLSAW